MQQGHSRWPPDTQAQREATGRAAGRQSGGCCGIGVARGRRRGGGKPHRGVSCEHGGTRHKDVVKPHETVVYAVVAELGADVAHLDAWQRLVCLHVSELHDKCMRAMVRACHKQACHDHGMRARFGETTRPPLCCSQRGGVYDELVRWLMKCGGCLETLHSWCCLSGMLNH